MNLDEMKDAKEQFEKAEQNLERIDSSLLRITEKHMKSSALKSVRHAIGRLDGMIEVEIDDKLDSSEDDNLTKEERIDKIIEEAEDMTSTEVDRAMGCFSSQFNVSDISRGDVRTRFESSSKRNQEGEA